PIFESVFPKSEQAYQATIQSLIKSPITSLLQVCIIAPVIEEILMRGFVLGGLKNTYGVIVALFISALFFTILHFNMVQTLSAFVCGIILGLLYIKTDSIPCCIIAHCGYNLISYFTTIYPYISK
ncbi:MAG: CPBP family intramembrane metalloprotease, partial [Lachnospiraceae bacterium]|nr:CPBP family intramembrane metalloprotease [Lachnospiraceae bacterium]